MLFVAVACVSLIAGIAGIVLTAHRMPPVARAEEPVLGPSSAALAHVYGRALPVRELGFAETIEAGPRDVW